MVLGFYSKFLTLTMIQGGVILDDVAYYVELVFLSSELIAQSLVEYALLSWRKEIISGLLT